MRAFWFSAVAVLWLQPGVAVAGKPLLELKVGSDVYVGRAVARNEETCWLQSADGRLTRLPLERVTEFRKVSPQFRGFSVTEAREQLSREWRTGFEVAAAGSYVVAAPPGKARAYAALLDEVHRSFATFFSRRDFKLTQPEFPLVAIIFPSEAAFAEYCESDGMSYAPGLRGYYNPDTNRIAFFEEQESVSWHPLELPFDRTLAVFNVSDRQVNRPSAGIELPEVAAVTTGAGFRDTLVHEATHQLAFNMSLHTRIGDNPRWVVEGLAMIFERNATGSGERHGKERQRVNEERYEWFMQRTRGNVLPIKDLIAADRPFGTATLDAYAESWALAFYLSERRGADYTAYLRRIQEHDPLVDYTPDERVADFQKAFGDDLDWLQVEWLRFMDGL